MKKSFALSTACVLIIVASVACSSLKVQTPEPTATEILPNMPNPAAVFCEQNGYTHKIRTEEDGSQSGVCVFPDDSSCDEWTYYRGECGPAVVTPEGSGSGPGGVDGTGEDGSGGYMQPGATEEFSDWWGVIKSTEPGAQYDDYFERQDLGQIIYFGIESIDPAVKSQIEALRDTDNVVHLYGTLFSNVPDYNGSQVQVDRIEY